MYLYEEDMDKVLVYEFSPNKDKILGYKEETISKIPKYKLFYLLTNGYRNIGETRDYYCPFNEKNYDNEHAIAAILLSRSKYYPDERLEKHVLNDYFMSNGKLLRNSSNDIYFMSHDEKSKSVFYTEVIKMPSKLTSLWMLEHGIFNDHNNELFKLFDFLPVREFEKKDIEELINYGLIDEATLNFYKSDVKVLKKTYAKK